MADSFITQCPHCGTSFRVKAEQLAIANGSVRCGACLQVFGARSHVVTTSIPAQSAGKATPTTKRAAPEAKQSTPMPPKQDSASFNADDDDSEFLFVDDEDDEFIFSDGDDDDLFDEDESNDGLGELSDTFLNLNNPNESPKQVDHFQSETQILNKELFEEVDDGNDESWAESMLDEIEKEEISLKKPAVFESKNMSSSPSQSDAHNAAMRRSALFADLEEEDDETSNNTSASQVVNQASQDFDLEFQFEDRLSRLRPLGWLFIVLLIAALLAQLAWLQRDTFARMDQWRGLYVKACDYIGCELPEQIDVNEIRTSVIVRDHKNTALSDIKIVDIVLTNRASFKQPFPEILLQYSDVNGKIIADQSFMPTDYLKGEMTGVSAMPLNTRIYISIPIQAPAESAVNYQLILNPISS